MRLAFTVLGMPPSAYSCEGKELPWRRKVAEAAKRLCINGAPYAPPENTEFTVRITFHMLDANIVGQGEQQGPDIDNLAKPVVDTLFLAPAQRTTKQGEAKPTGVLIKADDKWVFTLKCSKVRVLQRQEEGAVVVVEWPTH